MHRVCHSNVGIVFALLEHFEIVKYVVPLFSHIKVRCALKTDFYRGLYTRYYFELNYILARWLTSELLEALGWYLLYPFVLIFPSVKGFDIFKAFKLFWGEFI